jgi:hypothetical protein
MLKQPKGRGTKTVFPGNSPDHMTCTSWEEEKCHPPVFKVPLYQKCIHAGHYTSYEQMIRQLVSWCSSRLDILPGLKAEDSRIRPCTCSEPLQILFGDAAEMFATVHGLMQMTWYFSRRTG